MNYKFLPDARESKISGFLSREVAKSIQMLLLGQPWETKVWVMYTWLKYPFYWEHLSHGNPY